MVVMKGYVRNRAHPEGSMIGIYTTEEVIVCWVDYIKDGKPIAHLGSMGMNHDTVRRHGDVGQRRDGTGEGKGRR
jgi:hypothetical protein